MNRRDDRRAVSPSAVRHGRRNFGGGWIRIRLAFGRSRRETQR